MEKFQLNVFLHIAGIGAASGIVFHDAALFIIADNSSYLYEYHIDKKQLHKIALVENAQENIPKKQKPDLEAITFKKNKLILIGSGSKSTRNQVYTYSLKKKTVKQKDLTALYHSFKNNFNIDSDDLNIEGLIVTENNLLFFQRGNGANGKNGIFIVDEKTNAINFKEIVLPSIDNATYTFTDAILVDDKIYFLAAAEKSNSSYLDGEIAGTILGKMNLNDFKVEKTITLSHNQKFEGITLYKKSAKEITFLLCEDNDLENTDNQIYKLELHH